METNDMEVVYTDGITINDSDYRMHIGIETKKFRCSICRKVLNYSENYGGTYDHDGLKQHFCMNCISKLEEIVHVFESE